MTISTDRPADPAVEIRADDGHPLRGRWFAPDGEPRGVVVIVPAMATPAAFYTAFATWLRDRGHAVLTFDFRGHGESLTGHMRDVDADVVRWAHDARDALAYAHQRAGGAPVTWLGHSLGGQVLPFADPTLASRAIHIAAGNGWYGFNAPGARRLAPLVWKVVAPAAIALTGYYPGARLRLLGDLPPGVMRQWARWCTDHEYLLGELPEMRERYAAVDLPITSISFTDDELLSAQSISALEALYTGADITRARYTPGQLDVPRVGHVGFFRADHVDLWDEIVLPHLAT